MVFRSSYTEWQALGHHSDQYADVSLGQSRPWGENRAQSALPTSVYKHGSRPPFSAEESDAGVGEL